MWLCVQGGLAEQLVNELRFLHHRLLAHLFCRQEWLRLRSWNRGIQMREQRAQGEVVLAQGVEKVMGDGLDPSSGCHGDSNVFQKPSHVCAKVSRASSAKHHTYTVQLTRGSSREQAVQHG